MSASQVSFLFLPFNSNPLNLFSYKDQTIILGKLTWGNVHRSCFDWLSDITNEYNQNKRILRLEYKFPNIHFLWLLKYAIGQITFPEKREI